MKLTVAQPERNDNWFQEQLTSYPITQRYKPRQVPWFNAIVAALFALLLAGLVIWNYANSAYDLQPQTKSDPNATESAYFWYTNKVFTFGDDELKPKCQHLQLNVGDTFITNHFGFRYTVTRILFHRTDNANDYEPRTTIDYLNNTLRQCIVDRVTIEMHKLDTADPSNSAWTSWSGNTAGADAFASCSIENEEGSYTVMLRANYPGKNTMYDFIASDNITANAPLWWGSRLMGLYFVSTQAVMANMAPEPGTSSNYMHAKIDFHRKEANNITEVRGQDVFTHEIWFLRDDGFLRNQINYPGNYFNNNTHTFGRPLTEGLFFAKVFRSTVLADLGHDSTDNVLLNEASLKYILDPDDDFNRLPGGPLDLVMGAVDWWRLGGLSPPGNDTNLEDFAVPVERAFDTFQASSKYPMGDLSTAPATIYTQYICQLPSKKSKGTVVLFTVVATLSILQVAWAIYKLLLEYLATRRGREAAMWCRGCTKDDLEDGPDDKADPAVEPQAGSKDSAKSK